MKWFLPYCQSVLYIMVVFMPLFCIVTEVDAWLPLNHVVGRKSLSTTSHLQESTSSSSLDDLSSKVGESALSSVQYFGNRLSNPQLASTLYFGKPRKKPNFFDMADDEDRGGGIYEINKRQLSEIESSKKEKEKEKQVWEALANLEADMQYLDRMTGQKSQLSALEFTLLTSAVLSTMCSPLILGGRLADFVAPTAAAFTAAIGISAEYTGKVAVADGKEVAASAIQCAAESEGILANAERAKAITPLCVGIGATAATLALLVPVLLDSLGVGSNLQLVTEIYLCCPLIAVLAAAVAGLAVQEVDSLCKQAIGVGNRRFARSGLVGRTWLSSTELIERKSRSSMNKWKSFSLSVLPAPLLGALIPGALPTKTIVVAALAAAESAWYLARAEYILARATDAIALKARSAAVCDTYANQGMRSAAILPFTSALCGLCAAATAALVELPFVEALAEAGTALSTASLVGVLSFFPSLSALFAAAASVSKARCEVDAEASMQAASTIALPYEAKKDDPVLRPLKGVRELVRLTFSSSIREPFRRFIRQLSIFRWKVSFKKLRLRRRRSEIEAEPGIASPSATATTSTTAATNAA